MEVELPVPEKRSFKKEQVPKEKAVTKFVTALSFVYPIR
jgi:hypothetical protein